VLNLHRSCLLVVCIVDFEEENFVLTVERVSWLCSAKMAQSSCFYRTLLCILLFNWYEIDAVEQFLFEILILVSFFCDEVLLLGSSNVLFQLS